MNRRTLLKSLLGMAMLPAAVKVAAFAPEIPAAAIEARRVGKTMGTAANINTLLTPEDINREGLAMLNESMTSAALLIADQVDHALCTNERFGMFLDNKPVPTDGRMLWDCQTGTILYSEAFDPGRW